MKQAIRAWLLCLLSACAAAQVTGTIPSTGGGAACVTIGVGEKGSTVGITVTGTWSGTLQPEVSVQGQAAANTQVTPSTSSTAASTITANGTYFTVGVAGSDTFLLCGNTVASGTANIYLNISKAGSAAKTGSGGTVTSLTATSPIVVTPSPTTATGVISCPTCGTGTGSVTHTGSLTSGQVTIGNGTADVKVDTACSTDGAGTETCVALKTSGTNGGISGTEGTGAGLSAGAGTDIFWPDSSAHGWKFNANNAGAFNVVGVGTPGSSGHCPQFASNGINVVDSGTTNCGSASTAAIEYFAGCNTGTMTASQTTGIVQFGSNLSSTMCGALVTGGGVNPSHNCTLQNLHATASAGGKDGTDAVVSVNVAGSPSGITCTLGTGTNCQDITHSAAVTPVQKLTVQVITESGTTAANVGFSLQCL